MGRSSVARIKRAGPEIVLALVVVLGAVSFWQAWDIASHLREEARETSRIYGRIIGALNNPIPGSEAEILLELVTEIGATGIPVVVTDSAGRPTAAINLPFKAGLDDPRITSYAAELDRVNLPVIGAGVGTIHFGSLPRARRLRNFALLQLALLVSAVAAGVWAYRSAVARDRDRLWVATARESAHQLGTPLMSASAWVDRLATGDERSQDIARHLSADIERLQRVAQRFERIGHPARRLDRVALGVLVERVATYFNPRLPRLSNPVVINVRAPASGPNIAGDAVLLEWALEALVKNSVDALSGRGGTITVTVVGDGAAATLTVSDDGPGIPPEVRASLFEPGTSTKTGGWGIGLALARRIIEDVHGGTLELKPSIRGAVFVAQLPAGTA